MAAIIDLLFILHGFRNGLWLLYQTFTPFCIINLLRLISTNTLKTICGSNCTLSCNYLKLTSIESDAITGIWIGLSFLTAAMARVTAGLRWPPDTPPLKIMYENEI